MYNTYKAPCIIIYDLWFVLLSQIKKQQLTLFADNSFDDVHFI